MRSGVAELADATDSKSTALSAELLDHVEIRSASIIQSDDFSIDDGAFRKLDKSFNEIRKLTVEGFATAGVQVDFIARFELIASDLPVTGEQF